MKKMKKRLFSILFMCCMMLTLLPATAFAEDDTEELSVCICETACTAESMNTDCPVCGLEGALPEACGKAVPAAEGVTEEHDNAQVVTSADAQTLINALPEAEAITEDHAADMETQSEAIIKDHAVDVETQSEVIDEAKVQLSDEAHLHCICGGSVSAGDHTSHSDVTYTAWNGTDGITYNNNTAYVYLTDNATINSNLVVDGTTLYLCLNGKTYASNGTNKIQVKNGGRLVLCDCRGSGTIKGATSGWGGMCIYLYTSTLDMFGGKLTGGKVTGSGGGGAIALDDKNCVFNMYGGEISGNDGRNYGGAVFQNFAKNKPNATGGRFNMYGGVIKNNTAKNGGAFFSTTGGTIDMTGGTISGNTATMSSNDAGGGAIYMRGSGTINITGNAEITGNSSSLDGGAILMGWGTINMNGSAKINNNTASRWGGAICLRRDSNQVTQIIMRGGEISGNKAMKEGGAVHAVDKDCIFYLYDGKITGNTSVDGGAIYLNQEPSTLSMHGGEISGNTATGNGGGIYIYRTGSVCELYGGKIENNKASGSGGGIYINPSNSGKLRVGNTAVVQSNTVSGKSNNVYLPSGKTLSIGIGMTPPYASIGITTANTSYPVAFSDAYGKNYAECFFADDVNAHVEYKDDQKLYLVSGVVARPLTVTFDPNGGTLDEADKTRSVNTGERYGTLPVPSYAGYDFAGWYTEKNGGTEIKEDTTVTVAGTQTLYAHWTLIHVHAYTQQMQKPEALKTPADCAHNAVYYLSCACGEVSTNNADTFTAENTALDHDWGEWAQNSDGKTHTRVCKRDGNHTETGNCTGGTATCDKKAVCATCGKEYGSFDPANHSGTLSDWQTNDTEHWKEYTCCHTKRQRAAHDGGTATCQGKAVCLVCGQEYGSFDPANHTGTLSGWKTNGTEHWKEYNCCHAEVQCARHSFTAEAEQEAYLKSAATCTERAEYYKSCEVCGLSSIGTADEATFFSGNVLGHDWGEWTQNSDGKTHTRVCKRDSSHTETGNCTGGTATCTAKAVCEVCKAAYGEKNPDNHTAGCTPEWTITETEHEQKYSLCGKVTTKKSAHSFSDWAIIQEPTSSQDGEKEHICEICKYKETKTIPAAGDSGSNTNNTNNTNNTIRATAGSASAPQTGDSNQMLLWLSLLFASGFGVTGATLYGRRKKHSRQR